jgi:lipopolysaccharide/colanic/teichoic acid biosynthesis glycosyltransferase
MADPKFIEHRPLPPAGVERDPLALAGAGVADASAHRPSAAGEVARQGVRIARRALDMVIAALVLLFLLPLLLVVAALIKLDTPGPVFFRQRRLGKDMRPFTVLKFRTMRTDATSDAHRRYIAQLAQSQDGVDDATLKKLTDDPRVTRVGRTLRRLSIDEIPQLVNVLAGHMALVGPRPAIEYELEHYGLVHFERFSVRPGITGLWQVSGRSALGFKDMLDLDAEYATSATFWTDVRILARTPAAAFKNAA